MSSPPKSLGLEPNLHSYLVAHGSPPDQVLAELIEQTAALGQIARMQIAPEQGAFLTMLAQILEAKLIVEVGTFTGYSSICLARGLGAGGRLICCDISEEFTTIARRSWRAAGLDNRIDLRIAPAAETLRALPHDPVIDLAFIDADKAGYLDYYEQILDRLRPGGIIAVDNVLWSGRVVDSSDTSVDTVAIRRFNDVIASDKRVVTVMLPIADGLTLCRKL